MIDEPRAPESRAAATEEPAASKAPRPQAEEPYTVRPWTPSPAAPEPHTAPSPLAPERAPTPDPTSTGIPGAEPPPAEGPRPVEQTAGQARFQTCRWRKPAEAGAAAFCTHRDVLPMAGTHGFNPDSWCHDCEFYKLRRVPRRADM